MVQADERCISEPWADTTTHAGKMIMTVFSCFQDAFMTRSRR